MPGIFLWLYNGSGHIAAHPVRHENRRRVRRKTVNGLSVKIPFRNIDAQHLMFRFIGLFRVNQVLVRTEGDLFAVGIHCLFGIVFRIKHDTVFLPSLKSFGKLFFFVFFFPGPVLQKLIPFPLQYPDLFFDFGNFIPFPVRQVPFIVIRDFCSGTSLSFFQKDIPDWFGLGRMIDGISFFRRRLFCRCRGTRLRRSTAGRFGKSGFGRRL